MLAVAALAVLIPSAMPKGWLPAGCLARFGDPKAFNGYFTPLLPPDGRYLLNEYPATVIDPRTGKRFQLLDQSGRARGIDAKNLTTAGVLVTNEYPLTYRLSDHPKAQFTWRFAVLDYATGKPRTRYDPPGRQDDDLKGAYPSADGRTVLAEWKKPGGEDLTFTVHTPDGPPAGVPLATGKRVASGMLVSADGKRAACLVKDGERRHLDCFDTATGERVGRAIVPDPCEVLGALTADGKRIAVRGEAALAVFDLTTGERAWAANVAGHIPRFHFSPDGKTLFGLTDNGVRRRWDAADGKELAAENLALGFATERDRVAFTPDGRFLAVVGHDGPIKIIDRHTKTVTAELPYQAAARLERLDGDTAVLGRGRARYDWTWTTGSIGRRDFALGDDGPERTLGGTRPRYDLRCDTAKVDDKERESWFVLDTATAAKFPFTYKHPASDKRPRDSAQLTVNPTGLVAAVVDGDSDRDGRPGDLVVVIDATRDRQRARVPLPYRHHASSFWFAPDGRSLWVGMTRREGLRDGSDHSTSALLRIELATGTARQTLPILGCFPDTWRPDRTGRRVAIGYGYGEHGSACVFDLTAGKQVYAATSGAPLAFSTDGRWLFTSVGWLCDTHRPPGEASKLPVESPLLSAEFNAANDTLVTAHEDGCAYAWDVATLAKRRHLDQVPAFSPSADLWARLADADAAVAEAATVELLKQPAEAIRLAKTIPPVTAVPDAGLRATLAELGSREFAIRDDATKRLKEYREQAEPALLAALKTARPEAAGRIKKLLAELGEPDRSPESLLRLRAVELLERLGTAEAKAVLTAWAGGAPNARLTTEAKAALDRLGR